MKTLIIINGFLIPIIIITLLCFLIKDIIPTHPSSDSGQVNVNNVVVQDKDTLELQGVTYTEPETITNSSGYFIGLQSKTYEHPKSLSYEKKAEEETASRCNNTNLFNIIFLDHNFNPIKTLLNRKAFISNLSLTTSINRTIEPFIKNIIYKIAFADSNKDGFIDGSDNADLYISDLEGKHLIRITNQIDIEDYKFIDKGEALFIQYYDRSSVREEYKRLKFAVYNIKENRLKLLRNLDLAINNVNKLLSRK